MSGPSRRAPAGAGAAGEEGWMAGAGRAGRGLADALRLMVGVPNYGTYVAHRQATHPGEPVMDYETFFRERQQARYGGGNGRIGRCC